MSRRRVLSVRTSAYVSVRQRLPGIVFSYWNYILVGIVASGANLLLFDAMLHRFPLLMDSVIASVVAGSIAFALNYRTTFRKRIVRPAHHHAAIYAPIAIGSIAISTLVLWATVLSVGPIIGQGFGLIVGSVWGFGANRRWNFAVG